jgi:hypothetical protein
VLYVAATHSLPGISFDEFLTAIQALELLGFATSSGHAMVLTAAGRAVAADLQSKIAARMD